MTALRSLLIFLGFGGLFCLTGAVLIVAGLCLFIAPTLPPVEQLRDTQLQTPLRIYSRDGQLLAEFGEKRRQPIAYSQVPTQFIQALLAIEDSRFEHHYGIDPIGFGRAVLQLLATGQKRGGGSTLTQQVARNFFLTQQKTFTRKFTEMLLAVKMEHILSKPEIFELYINKHFLGHRAYGIQAAAQVYYGRDINELTLPELAMIAGLNQAPSTANPLSNPARALERRNRVLTRMFDLGYIQASTYQHAIAAPLTARALTSRIVVSAPYVAEMVRQQLEPTYGEALYTSGLNVYTTVDAQAQRSANQALISGLLAYSLRHGYSGPEQHWSQTSADPALNLQHWLERLQREPIIADLEPAVVLSATADALYMLRRTGETVQIARDDLDWARPRIDIDHTGRLPEQLATQFAPGDLLRIIATQDRWALTQLPQAQGALVALNPNNGAIIALVGGFDFALSKYNRATQAHRQPGSNFKPFVYAAALEKGLMLTTRLNDAPITFAENDGLFWRPQNAGDRYLGPITLRKALTQSRNVPSVRLLERIGIGYALNYVTRFGFTPEQLAQDRTLVLGSTTLAPLAIARAYAVFANQGYLIDPYIIERIEAANGDRLFQAMPPTRCIHCDDMAGASTTETSGPPAAPQVLRPEIAFLIDSILKDVVHPNRSGTARQAGQQLRRSDIAGKTGTTNNAVDAWFTGYTPNLVATTWVGRDDATSLGQSEYGGKAALPIWIDFMRNRLNNTPETVLPPPPGIIRLRIDAQTGALARSGQAQAVFEYFAEPFLPSTVDSAGPAVQSPQTHQSIEGPSPSLQNLF